MNSRNTLNFPNYRLTSINSLANCVDKFPGSAQIIEDLDNGHFQNGDSPDQTEHIDSYQQTQRAIPHIFIYFWQYYGL